MGPTAATQPIPLSYKHSEVEDDEIDIDINGDLN